MILFLIDLYKIENTCVCLIIIKIEPNFRSLFCHESIIKTFCTREQSTSQVHTHTFIEFKKKKNNESYKIVRFCQGFEKRFVVSLRDFALYFFVFFFWLIFFLAFYRRVRLPAQ